MKLEEIVIGIIASLIVVAIGWLVKEVLSIRSQLVKLQTQVNYQMKTITDNCLRHQRWAGQLQKSIHRMDKNIIAIAIKQGVEHHPSSDDGNGNGIDFNNNFTGDLDSEGEDNEC